jgi:hypothetical protein
MTVQEIAKRLVELCSQGQYETAQKELYAENATSTEPADSPGLQSVQGRAALIEKGHAFQAMVEQVHGGHVSDPIISGSCFAVSLSLDITMKGQGRTMMDEICVYKVKDGKIISEQFFY